MKSVRWLWWMLSPVTCCLAADQPVAVFEARDVANLDWPRTLVTYHVAAPGATTPSAPTRSHVVMSVPVFPEALKLINAETGEEVPFQMWDVQPGSRGADGRVVRKSARISFFAELAAGGRYRYELRAGTPQPVSSVRPPSVLSDGGFIALDNGIVGIRLPETGVRQFRPAIALGSNGVETDDSGRTVAPGPVLGFRLADGTWVGGSFLRADPGPKAPKVTQIESRVSNNGPLFVEGQVTYRFEGGGWYTLTARVLAGDPAVRIDEQADLGMTGSFSAVQVVFDLTSPSGTGQGWQPDWVFWHTSEGRLAGHDEAVEAALEAAGLRTGDRLTVRDRGSRSVPTAPGRIFDVAVWYPWHPNAYYFGLLRTADIRPNANTDRVPFQAIVPMHAGTWRGAVDVFNGVFSRSDSGALVLTWPLLVPPHPNTALHTGEYDPDLPYSCIRRQWAWVGGPPQYHETLYPLRAVEGYINLDTYKDWIVDWEGSDAPETYPRLVVSAEFIKALGGRLDNHPEGQALRDLLFVEDSEQRRNALVSGLLKNNDAWSSPFGVLRYGLRSSWRSDFHWATRTGWAFTADETLAIASLDTETRRRLRSLVAAYCHLLSDPDFNPRGSMVHLGNPNMPINRFMGLAFASAVVSDHPLAPTWLDTAAQYVAYKLAMNTAPGGAWSELITYYYASAPFSINGALAAEGAGRLEPAVREVAAQVAEFTMKLITPPDPRAGGKRLVPGFGHEGGFGSTGLNNGGVHFLSAAGLLRRHDPDRAAALVWAWDQIGRPGNQAFDTGFGTRTIVHADLLERASPAIIQKALASAWLPGFGAVLRAHVGTPQETYLAYRQGYMHSHSDENQGDFVLYARGAPLTVMSLHSYPIHQHPEFITLYKEFGWHSRIRFGEQTNSGGFPGGGIRSQIHAHAFGDSLDYLRGDGDYDPQRWTRQILLLKSRRPGGPEYFIFRDCFTPTERSTTPLERKWWYQRTAGPSDCVKPAGSGFDYDGPYGAKMQVRLIEPASATLESRQASRPGRIPGIEADDVLTINALGPIAPGQDIMVAITPLGQDEEPPQFERLGKGVVKVLTREGTDYIFAHVEPIHFRDEDITFSGKAGAVRVFPDEVHLVIAEGPAEVRFGSLTLRGTGPAERRFPRPSLPKETVIERPPLQHDIRLPTISSVRDQQSLHPGVTRYETEKGMVIVFEAEAPFTFEADGMMFQGRLGAIAVDRQAGTTRLTVIEGNAIGYEAFRAWGAEGPWDLVYRADHLSGRFDGLGRFLYVRRPPSLDVLPVYRLDDRSYAPGTEGDTLILPLMPGPHRFEVRALEQPRIFRTLRDWTEVPVALKPEKQGDP